MVEVNKFFIGRASLNIIEKDLKKFKIYLLSANSNYSLINKQIQKYKPNIFVINNFSVYKKIEKKYKNSSIIIYNNFSEFIKKKFKFDITISAIVGIAGLGKGIDSLVMSGSALSNTFGIMPLTPPRTLFIILFWNCSDVTYL